MEKISWVNKINNEEVLQRVNETKAVLDKVRKRQHVWLGHVLHDIIEGRMRESLEVRKQCAC